LLENRPGSLPFGLPLRTRGFSPYPEDTTMSHPHLEAAQEAIAYVRVKLNILASNREWDRTRYENERGSQEQMSQQGDQMVTEYLQATLSDSWDNKKEIQWMAEYGTTNRFGNCEVQASVAFDYLAKKGVRPLEMIYFAPPPNFQAKHINLPVTGTQATLEAVDHTFVVIGRDATSNVKDYTTWNMDAVVCDPWAKRCYFARHLIAESELLKGVTGGVTETGQKYRLGKGNPW
jgi:hypothetical protein